MKPRLLSFVAAVAVVAAACGPGDFRTESPPASELGFIPQVIDIQGAAGAGVSLTTDAEGNPHLAYLTFEREVAPGERIPAPDPMEPTYPAVRHAHFTGGVWTKSNVAEELQVTEEDATGIAVDAEGVHHIVWTEGGRIRYTANAGGEFSEPADVAEGDVTGLAITAADDGTPWVSFYELGAAAEGPAALVRVAHPEGEEWQVETAAEADPQEPMTTGIGSAGGRVLVAYGSGTTTFVARSGQIWESEQADADGGLGVDLHLDGDGNPHLSYYTSEGGVRHAHSVGGSPWEVTDLGDAGSTPEAGWITSISLAQDGTHWVGWQAGDELAAATNQGGSFEPVEVRSSAGGTRPQIGAGAEGTAYLGWHDTEDLSLNVSVRSDDDPLLAGPPAETEAPQPGPTDGGGDGGPPPCEPEGTELQIAAPVGAAGSGFETDCLAAAAGDAYTIAFDNQDSGVPHNVAIYDSEQAAQEFFVGEIITGPDTITYEPDPIDEAGQYFFRCDVHPTTMTGTFVVQ